MTRRLTSYDLALWAALPMAHTPRLEGRLQMILDRTRSRRPRSAGDAAARRMGAIRTLSVHDAPPTAGGVGRAERRE